jgi:hypothetical protein
VFVSTSFVGDFFFFELTKLMIQGFKKNACLKSFFLFHLSLAVDCKGQEVSEEDFLVLVYSENQQKKIS